MDTVTQCVYHEGSMTQVLLPDDPLDIHFELRSERLSRTGNAHTP